MQAEESTVKTNVAQMAENKEGRNSFQDVTVETNIIY